MASRLNHDGAVPSSNHENTTETAAGQLISAINQIAGSSAYKLLNKLYEDNQSMKKDVQERTIISEKIMADLMNSRSEAADLKAKIRDLIEANEKLEREITQKKENIQILTEQRKNVDQELTKAYKKVKMHEADKEELLKKLEALPVLERRLKDTEASEKELKRLQLFAADLTDIQSVGDTIAQSLADTFKEAYAIANSFFYQELDDELLAFSAWAEVERRVKNKDYLPLLPLPRSNSLVARKMRFATGLMMLGDSLGTYVFQSVYVAKEENAFSEVLKELGEKDARHEAHARAVVLSLYNNNQEQYGEALAAMAARETMDTISGLVPKADHPKLVKQLQSFCHEAMLRWLPVQRLNELVMADIDAVANEYWKILPFPVHDITNQQAQQSNTVQGDGSSNGSAKNRSSQNQRHRSTAAQSVRLTDNDEVYEIWPAFKTQKQTLCQGFIVMEKLRQEAKKDEEAVRQKEEELRRSGRKLSRKGTGDATNGGGQTRQATGGSFLSSGNGKASAVG